MNLEIFKCSTNVYEVIDNYGVRVFVGTLAEWCEEFVYEASMDDEEYELD